METLWCEIHIFNTKKSLLYLFIFSTFPFTALNIHLLIGSAPGVLALFTPLAKLGLLTGAG